MRTPRHLWAGDWERERAAREAEPAREPRQPAPDAPAEPDAPTERHAVAQADPEPVRARPRGREPVRTAVAVAVALAVVVGAAAIGARLDGRPQSSGTAAQTPSRTLPAAPPLARGGSTKASPAAVYAAASPAVVSIRTGQGSGSGFLVDDRRTIVTNAHVVTGSRRVVVRFGTSGDAIDGTVLGTDSSSDLAVVRIPQGSAPADTKPLVLANSDDVQVGDQVVAIGNPFGLDRTATEGIVSAVGREIRAPDGFSISDAIQTDAPINPGNSGGPLLDAAARVVGVNSQIETSGGSGGNVGIGFAVSSNTVRRIVPQLEQGQHVRHAWLGVEMSSTASGGAPVISNASGGGPAARAGLRAGDVILAIDGHDVHDFSDVSGAVNAHKPGDHVKLRVRRNGSERTIDVTLGTRPARVP